MPGYKYSIKPSAALHLGLQFLHLRREKTNNPDGAYLSLNQEPTVLAQRPNSTKLHTHSQAKKDQELLHRRLLFLHVRRKRTNNLERTDLSLSQKRTIPAYKKSNKQRSRPSSPRPPTPPSACRPTPRTGRRSNWSTTRRKAAGGDGFVPKAAGAAAATAQMRSRPAAALAGDPRRR